MFCEISSSTSSSSSIAIVMMIVMYDIPLSASMMILSSMFIFWCDDCMCTCSWEHNTSCRHLPIYLPIYLSTYLSTYIYSSNLVAVLLNSIISSLHLTYEKKIKVSIYSIYVWNVSDYVSLFTVIAHRSTPSHCILMLILHLPGHTVFFFLSSRTFLIAWYNRIVFCG